MPAPLRIEPITMPAPARHIVALRLGVTITDLSRRFIAARREGGQLDQAATARAIRATFDSLGGTFAKFSQLIASSPGIFSDEVAAEFRGSLDAAAAEPFASVRQVVENELGRPLEDLFSSFEPEPIAAASLAVVHRAVLPDGRPVAVKVLRPRIEQRIATDLAILRPLCRFIAREVAVGIAGTLNGLIEGLRVQLAEELDLRNEARASAWFAGVLDEVGASHVRVPATIDDWSARRVLTMELIDGVAVDDEDAIAAMGVDPAPLLRDCLRTWFAATLATGTFHGDIHAGNLLVTPEGTLVLVDWGIVGRLDESTSLFFRRLIEGALGDEAAWHDVAAHLISAYGASVLDALGTDEAGFAEFVRLQIEPVLRLPFGEVDLRTMLIGDGAQDGKRAGERTKVEAVRNWWAERARIRRMMELEGYGGGFDQATFLLSKQLVYFDKYGKRYLPDTPLLDDVDVYRALLAPPGAPVS